ncbi:MAG: CpsB/CapC family capsule biosynthesis tyrosine phosphatase [Gemmatimonadales bacterium]
MVPGATEARVSAVAGLTDFHSHLIPGVDDGAQRPDDSAAALGRFRAEGVTQLITTPHFVGSLTLDPELLAERLEELDAGWEVLRGVVAADAAKAGSAIRVERGVEVMLDLPDPDLSDARLRLAGGPFALVEYPGLRLPPVNADFALVALRRRGFLPVVAHPERYRNLDGSLAELMQFRAAGAFLAVNAGSLFGDYGKTAAAHARNILMAGLADYVVSDYHARGEPGLARFAKALTDAGFTEQAELLTVRNAARLLAGEAPLPVPSMQAPRQQRSLWERLFG